MQPFYNSGTKQLTLQLGADHLLPGRVGGGVAILLWGHFKIMWLWGSFSDKEALVLGDILINFMKVV